MLSGAEGGGANADGLEREPGAAAATQPAAAARRRAWSGDHSAGARQCVHSAAASPRASMLGLASSLTVAAGEARC